MLVERLLLSCMGLSDIHGMCGMNFQPSARQEVLPLRLGGIWLVRPVKWISVLLAIARCANGCP